MKNKEINLSSNTLEDSINRVIDEKKVGEEKKEKKVGKFRMKIRNIKKKLKDWWIKRPKYQKVLLIVIPALLILAGSIFFVYQVIFGPKNTTPRLINIQEAFLAPKDLKSENLFKEIYLKEPSIPRTEESPINGRLFTKDEMEELEERRPIAVIINNNPLARPTSNISQADLMFETLVEGGSTRMLAIYWSRDPGKVGTIRSARQYYLEWLLPFDPLFIYDGFASSSDPKVDAGGNIRRYNIKSIYTRGAWRVQDRVAPHNEYSSTTKTWEYATEVKGWDEFPDVEAWEFKKDIGRDDRTDRFRAKVMFGNDSNYDVNWEYDKNTNMYLRSVGGSQDLDLETGQQLTAKNVIIQEVKIESSGDKYHRLIINTIGSGRVKILMDGKVIDGTWEKSDKSSRTKYFDNERNEIELNRGLSWIQAVGHLDTNFDIIEQ